MNSSIPKLRSFVTMPGPNLFASLPGARMQIDWPAALLAPGGDSARRIGMRLVEIPALRSVASAMAQEESAPIEDGRLALDRLVELVADAIVRFAAQPAAGVRASRVALSANRGVVVHHRDASLAVHASRAALALTTIGVEAETGAFGASELVERATRVLENFRSRWTEIGFGEMNWRKVDAAERRSIPWRRVIENDRVVRLGHGVRQVRTRDSMIEGDGYIAAYLASNKHVACELMHGNGLPAPRNFVVLDQGAAIRAARALGYPVVVKPAMTDFGTAVSINLKSDEAVAAAFERARRHGMVIVEQHVAGTNFRFLVMHGKFIAAVRQEPAHVIGDGQHSVAELVESANRDRSEYLSTRLKKISFDEDVVRILHLQGIDIDSVPPAGRRVQLHEHSNLSVGGTYENITTAVHPDNRALAERAAQVFGLKMAGIDYISVDAARSHLETGGMICEVNPSPGMVMGMTGHTAEDAFVDGLFPDGSNGRIPIIALLGDQGKPGLIDRLERLAVELGHNPAVAAPGSIRSGGRTVAVGQSDQSVAVSAALNDPSATAVIVQLTRGGIARSGLVFDRCDLSVVVDGGAANASSSSTDTGSGIASLLSRHSRRFQPTAAMGDIEYSMRLALTEQP